ncbi:MAG: hypothetical protein KDD25_07750, partial [Bdellovibrionales bacterium]|nr:hypothetical protein [Bdellovibrionales bacterium]
MKMLIGALIAATAIGCSNYQSKSKTHSKSETPRPLKPLKIDDRPFYTWGGETDRIFGGLNADSYLIRIKVDPKNKWIGGEVEISISSLGPYFETLPIDLIDRLRVSKVFDQNGYLSFEQKHDKVFVRADLKPFETRSITFAYSGHPLEADVPPYHGGVNWDHSKNGKPWVGVSCQLNGPYVWFPSFNDHTQEPQHVTLEITYPSDLVGVGPGLKTTEFT